MTNEAVIRSLITQIGEENTERGLLAAARLWDGLLGPMNVKEASEYLKQAQGTIKNKVSRYELPYHKNPKLVFFRAEIIEDILDEGERGRTQVA